MSEAVAVKEQKASLVYHNGEIQLENIEGAYRFAQAVIKSELAPKHFKTPEQVLIAWQHGAELKMKPMQALQNIAVINGRPSVWGKATAGIVVASGLCEIFEEWFEGKEFEDDYTACCKVKRIGISTIRIERYTVADAKRAGLWGKAGPWVQYSKDMLRYKSRSRAFVLFADALTGLPIMEDIQDVPAERPALTERATEASPDPLLAPAVEVVQGEVQEEMLLDTSDRS